MTVPEYQKYIDSDIFELQNALYGDCEIVDCQDYYDTCPDDLDVSCYTPEELADIDCDDLPF